MRTITGVDNGRVTHPREVVWRTGHRMTHHDAVRRHCLQIASRIQECLSLAHAGSGNADVDCVGRKAFGSDLEGGSGSRGRFEKEIDDCASPQRGYLLYFATRDIAKRFRRIEQVRDLAGFEFAYTE